MIKTNIPESEDFYVAVKQGDLDEMLRQMQAVCKDSSRRWAKMALFSLFFGMTVGFLYGMDFVSRSINAILK